MYITGPSAILRICNLCKRQAWTNFLIITIGVTGQLDSAGPLGAHQGTGLLVTSASCWLRADVSHLEVGLSVFSVGSTALNFWINYPELWINLWIFISLSLSLSLSLSHSLPVPSYLLFETGSPSVFICPPTHPLQPSLYKSICRAQLAQPQGRPVHLRPPGWPRGPPLEHMVSPGRRVNHTVHRVR